MWSQYYQASLSRLLRKSILVLCSENVPFEEKLEIDGIICISTASADKQIVVKVHEIVENIRGKNSEVSLGANGESNVKSASSEQDDEEIFTIESQEGPRSTNGYSSVDSAASSPCEIAVAVENGTSVEYTVTAGTGIQQSPHNSDQENGEATATRTKRLPCKDIFPFRRVQKTVHRMSSNESETSEDSKSSNGDGVLTITHQGEYLCRLCGHRCTTFSSLNTHNYNVHCRFTCRQCLNTFSMMCNLKRHERLHMGRKQFNCGTCGKGFSRNSDLRIHSLKVHCHPAGNTHPYRQNEDYPSVLQERVEQDKKAKSVVLGDILTKLAQKQLQNLREREKKVEGCDSLSDVPPQVHVIEPKHEDDPQDEPNENIVDLTQSRGGDSGDDMIMSSRKQPQSSAIPTPQFAPTFTRSILKPSVQDDPMSTKPQNIVHIYPTSNSSSGGHMEEGPVTKKMKYMSQSVPVSPERCISPDPSQQQQYVSALHGHGLSFGRIVFPDQQQTSNIKSEPVEERGGGGPELELGLTSLPFLTYSGRKVSVGEFQMRGETQVEALCVSPLPMMVAPPVRSRSASPQPRTPSGSSRSASPRISEHPDSPALISLDRRYWCHLCKTPWENFASYEAHHVSQHLRYPCQFCDQTFSNKNNRSRHIRSHTGQKEHVCGDCGKSFSRSDTLKEHQIIHTEGYLGDQCDYCHIVIKKKAELLGHIKKCPHRQRARHSASASPSSLSD